MRTKNIFKTLAALLMACVAFTACSDKDDIANETLQPVTTMNKYTMTVNATKSNDGSTRALALDGKTLKVKWADTDQVSVFKAKTTTLLGTLTAAASETATTKLSGNLTGTVNVGDKLHLIFPRPEWDYTGQEGILLDDENSIEKKYDYAITDVTVASIDDSHITTTADANFASQQAIVKFILKNKDGGATINAKKLTVTAAGNKLVTSKRLSDNNYYSGYTVDAGSGGISGDDHTHLVDGDLDTKWCANSPWYIEFHTDAPVRVDGYMFRTAGDTESYSGRNPMSWVLKGKANSGDAWTTIDSKSGNTDMPAENNTERDFTASAPGTYQYFRLEISESQGSDIMQLSEMKLFAKLDEATEISYYGPITVTPDAAASELTVALRNEKAGADTYTLTAVAGDEVYALEKSGVTFENGKYYEITAKLTKQKIIDLSGVTEDKTIEDGYTITGTLTDQHWISIAADATVTLNNVTITNSNITCRGNANIILVGTNSITAPADYAALRMGDAGTTLTISGTGTLNANGGAGSAGIGTGHGENVEKTAGNITINSGTINATGGEYGAGIGNGLTFGAGHDTSTTCGDITINGGTVTATGGDSAAGIGTGKASTNDTDDDEEVTNKCGNIKITGGTVTATGGFSSAGIGTGLARTNEDGDEAHNECGDILITGGTVTATGGNYLGAAGIGTGVTIRDDGGDTNNKCGAITITSGVTKVTATKSVGSPCSIGKGNGENGGPCECGTITIGGTVYPDGISDSPYTYPAQ